MQIEMVCTLQAFQNAKRSIRSNNKKKRLFLIGIQITEFFLRKFHVC